MSTCRVIVIQRHSKPRFKLLSRPTYCGSDRRWSRAWRCTLSRARGQGNDWFSNKTQRWPQSVIRSPSSLSRRPVETTFTSSAHSQLATLSRVSWQGRLTLLVHKSFVILTISCLRCVIMTWIAPLYNVECKSIKITRIYFSNKTNNYNALSTAHTRAGFVRGFRALRQMADPHRKLEKQTGVVG